MGIEISLDGTDEFAMGRRGSTAELGALDEHDLFVIPALLAAIEVGPLRGIGGQ
ncbi:MAG: hypothetical protein ACKV2O_20680 [Acidimicrobiales bacterium]